MSLFFDDLNFLKELNYIINYKKKLINDPKINN